MPKKGGQWTKEEIAFVKEYSRTGDHIEAAKRAGYGTPAARAHENLAKPALQIAIAAEQRKRLFSVTLPLAVETLEEVLRNKSGPAGARVQAVKVAFDYTLGQKDDAADLDPANMTAEQLQRRIDELNRLASDKAKPILEATAEPGSVIDIFA